MLSLSLQKFNVTHQKEIDNFLSNLDRNSNNTDLGANSILAVSLAVAKAGAFYKGLPLYKYIAELAGVKKVNLFFFAYIMHFNIYTSK